MALPISAATAPRIVNVIAIPNANIKDNLNAFFVSCAPVPPTYPIISGIVDNEHGVNAVSIPANSEMIGAIQKLFFNNSDNVSNMLVIDNSFHLIFFILI